MDKLEDISGRIRMNITGAQLKRLLNEKFEVIAMSVRRGRGSAYNWWYIHTYEPIDAEVKHMVENFLVDETLASTYYTDYGPNNRYAACIRWTSM